MDSDWSRRSRHDTPAKPGLHTQKPRKTPMVFRFKKQAPPGELASGASLQSSEEQGSLGSQGTRGSEGQDGPDEPYWLRDVTTNSYKFWF